MTYRNKLRENPAKYDFFAMMRELERTYLNKPRIGKSANTGQEIVSLGQDPFLEFPGANIVAFDDTEGKTPELTTRFLGFFGPQGALPLSTTVEAHQWALAKDNSFAKFTNIFANRFQQLFFRAWGDSRPIVQHDRPDDDRFQDYVGSMAGIGSKAFQNFDSIPDIAKIPFAGMIGSRAKSAQRIKQLISGVLGLDVEIREHVTSWLPFEPTDTAKLGEQKSSLGMDCFLGDRIATITDKICVVIETKTLAQYESYLPDGKNFEGLTDLITFCIGDFIECDIELALPASEAPPMTLGESGALGWTGWLSPEEDTDDDEPKFIHDAVFSANANHSNLEQLNT